jgi:hypothetical protein
LPPLEENNPPQKAGNPKPSKSQKNPNNSGRIKKTIIDPECSGIKNETE